MIGRLVMALIRVYQRCVSPWFGSCCRFYPSCSEYMRLAIARHGCGRGLWMGICRLLKCHPFHPGGVDLVPGTGPTGRETG
ncbi:MAG: membrane protein insertion efficiency factor YidD [Lentisphaerae bacterium RIFOXYB12_FULL_60_10]|nr:MAG: membrane protein insertion efficiency factor YidD [Lentisphaerae bacterium RIFOXYA12_FULL_60_10]OGV86888.1 MAG: membrane protein insertion efficiency factor YidD [Lentisphaerae bacterium RIFOXYB12_FULL_60_10]